MLEIAALSKRFGSTLALDAIEFRLGKGEVHAIVGENGAGKSTFVKVLGGVYRPDAGRITLDGREVTLDDPARAKALGIHVIHQNRQLVPSLSGLENIFLSLPYPRHGPLVDWVAMRARAEAVLDELHIDLPLARPVKDMSPAAQTLLELVRAYLARSRIVILDEPTASLTDHEVGILFSLLRRLRESGASFIYVSHRLEEVLAIATTITVFRNGRIAGHLGAAETNRDELVSLITGRAPAMGAARAYHDARGGQPLLEVRDLATRDGRVRGASLNLYPGEVLGLFGLAGSGRTELVEAIYGLRPLARGEIRVRGQRQGHPTPQRWLRAGLVMIGEDRHIHGLVPRRSLRDNMTLQTIGAHSRFGLIRRASEARTVRAQIAGLEIRAAGPHQVIDTLSGGNQQKVLLARMFLAGPAILLCDEPTHAVDVGTRQRIHGLLTERAHAGCGVLFVSSDLGELLEVADRMVVMGAGRTVGTALHGELTAEAIMGLCYAAAEERPA